MFSSKTSDYWYNDIDDEFYVCTVSSISAAGDPCRGVNKTHIAIYPTIHKIDRQDNKKQLVYPTFTPTMSTLFAFVPSISSNVNFKEITKPVWSYNTSTELYSITFLGKYEESSQGFGIISHIFQNNNGGFFLADVKTILPPNEFYGQGEKYTFVDGNLNRDFELYSAETRDSIAVLATGYRAPNYKVIPTHDIENDTLDFNMINYEGDRYTLTNQTGFLVSKNEYFTNEDIRIDFTARFEHKGASQDVAVSEFNDGGEGNVGRRITLQNITGKGEGFSIFFFTGNFKSNGVNSTLGYAPASEVLVERSGGTEISLPGLRNAYLGVGFDVSGYYCTTGEGKSEGINNTYYSPLSSTIGVRGDVDNNYKVIYRTNQLNFDFITVTATPSASNFKDYRVELKEEGERLLVYGKASTDSSYTELLDLKLYTQDYAYEVPEKVKIGLAVSSSHNYVGEFKLKSFKVEGVR